MLLYCLSNLLFYLKMKEGTRVYYKTITNKKGVRFEVLERYKNPLTGKWKTASVSYTKDTIGREDRQNEI